MADVFTLTICKPAGSRLFGETRESERQRLAHLLHDAAQNVGTPGHTPEPHQTPEPPETPKPSDN